MDGVKELRDARYNYREKKNSDRSNIELFSDEYRNNITCNIFSLDDDVNNMITAYGGQVKLDKVETWKLKKVF